MPVSCSTGEREGWEEMRWKFLLRVREEEDGVGIEGMGSYAG